MENEAKKSRLLPIAAGIAAAALAVLELYMAITTPYSGGDIVWGTICIIGYLCASAGCFSRQRIALGVGAAMVAAVLLRSTIFSADYARQIWSYYDISELTPLLIYLAYRLINTIAWAVLAIMSFMRKDPGRAGTILVAILVAAYAVASLTYSHVLLNILMVGLSAACLLCSAIAIGRGELPAKGSAPQTEPQAAISSDELLRLHALMEEGVLSQEEFEDIRSKFAQ